MKTICFMPRRPDWSRAQLRDYYEHKHSPLALRWFAFDKYVRNHLTADAGEPGFDCYTEFWSTPTPGSADLMAGPVGDTMRADERIFSDQPQIRAALCDERPVSGPPRDIEHGVAHMLLLFERDGGSDDALADWLAGIACMRAILDFLTAFESYGAIRWAAAALLWDPPSMLPDPPAGWTLTHRLATEAFEYTPAEMLAMRETA